LLIFHSLQYIKNYKKIYDEISTKAPNESPQIKKQKSNFATQILSMLKLINPGLDFGIGVDIFHGNSHFLENMKKILENFPGKANDSSANVSIVAMILQFHEKSKKEKNYLEFSAILREISLLIQELIPTTNENNNNNNNVTVTPSIKDSKNEIEDERQKKINLRQSQILAQFKKQQEKFKTSVSIYTLIHLLDW
jgi:hypothetical protein